MPKEPKKRMYKEPELIAIINGMKKHHGKALWPCGGREAFLCRYKAVFEAIRDDSPRVLATRTPYSLGEKWLHLVSLCGTEGSDVGNGKIRRGRTTLPESQWARIARLVEGTPLTPTKRRPPSGRHPPRAKMSEERRKAERLKASVRKWKAKVREAETPEERRAHHITLLGYLRAATRAGLLWEVATEVPCS